MNLLLKNLVAAWVLALGVSLGGGASALQNPDFGETERAYAQTLSKRQRQVERLERLEDEYRALVSDIEKLKSSGGMTTIAGRIELQNLLTKSKALADELDAIQAELRTLDNRLDGQRSTLVSGIDGKVRELERSLGSASPSARAGIVAELNRLRQRRSRFAPAIPAGPSQGDVSSALRLAEEVADHPDELMAAADELLDTEDQLRKRLAAIDGKLEELEDARALMRRARTFSREERFFEETDRERAPSKFDRTTTVATREPSQDKANTGGSEPVATAGPETDDASANNGAGFAAEEPMAGAPMSDADGAESRGVADPALSDAPSQAEVAPPSSGEPSLFETSRETIVIGGGNDPVRSVGSIGGSERDVDGQIRSLEKERERLKKQAEKLRKRAQQLRDRAGNL